MSTFFGLNIARLGMQAQQKALEVTAHNVANANTPGFSRQVAHMSPTAALPYAQKGMLGSGVLVDEVARVRDEFLDRQIRHEQHSLGQWSARSAYLSQIEQIFLEPTENGFNAVLSTFFDSWQELSLNPESSSARTALLENSNLLLNAVKQTYQQLTTVGEDISQNIALKIKEVNSLAVQISDLNQQITRLVSSNNRPSDLLDRRDLLLEQLAEIMDFTATATGNGSVNILIAGQPLVHENISYALATKPGAVDGNGWQAAPTVIWAKSEQTVPIGNGEIYGLTQLHGENLRCYVEDFTSLTWALVHAVNTLHQGGSNLHGTGGEAFFSGDHLQTLQLNPALLADPGRIAAAAATPDGTPIPGDGSNAVHLAQLRTASFRLDPAAPLSERLVLDQADGTMVLEFFYRDTIARLGVDSQESGRMTENQNSLLELLGNRRSAISGVWLDEELANMVQYQLAYQASARFLSALNEIYDTLINGII